jgi:UDP-glucose 4-epimerase
MSHPYQDYQRTVGTTLSVLEFIRLHLPSAKLVYPSSAAVYGNVSQLPINEKAPLHPVSMYGVHKKIAEELCIAYGNHYAVSTAVVRFFSVFGVGLRKQLLWDACEKIEKGNFRFFGSGNETRDWLHIDDAVSLLFRAGENASTDCPIVNGGCGAELPVRDLLKELFSAFFVSDPPQFSGESPIGDPSRYCADLSKSQKWGWIPKKSLREGIREYAEWYQNGAK